MYRKIVAALVLLFAFAPFLAAVFIGYPLAAAPHPDGSVRCFKTGEWGQFTGCFQAGRVLKTGRLLGLIARDTGSFSVLFPAILAGALGGMCIGAGLAAFQGETVEEKKLQHPVDQEK